MISGSAALGGQVQQRVSQTPTATANRNFKAQHYLFALALVFLAIGFSDAQENAFFYLGRPVGAILLGVAMILTVLSKEMETYDGP